MAITIPQEKLDDLINSRYSDIVADYFDSHPEEAEKLQRFAEEWAAQQIHDDEVTP